MSKNLFLLNKEVLKRVLQYLLILPLFTPLFLDLHFYQPYVAGKYFYLITWLLISLPLVVYFFWQKRDIWKERLPRFTLIYFLALIVISLFSVDLSRSWWGDWARMDGLFYFLLWLIFYFGLILAFDKKESWFDLLRINQLVLLLCVFFAWGQWLSWPLLQDDQASRVFSLIGNANFFAHYLLFGFWLSIFAYYFDTKYRYGYLAVAVLSLPIIYQTGSRAVFIALLVTSLIFIIRQLIKYWSKYRKQTILAIIVLIVLLFTGYLGINQRFKSYNFTNTTIETRLVAWQSGFNGFKEKPLLGWGRNNFQIVFNKYLDLRIYRDANSRLWFDKAHNQYIDYLVEGGLIGLLIYLLWLALPFLYLKKIKEKYSADLAWILGLGLTANLIYLLFNFDTIISWLMYFIYLALIYWLSQNNISVHPIKHLQTKVFIFVLSGILTVIGLYQLVYLPSLANYQAKKIFLAKQKNYTWSEIDQSFEQAKKYTPQYQADLVVALGGILDQVDWPWRQDLDALDKLAEETKLAIQSHMLDAKLHFLLANIYWQQGHLAQSAVSLQHARDYYENVLPYLTPTERPDFIYNLSQIYYELSFYDQDNADSLLLKAEMLLQANAQRFPNNPEAKDKLKTFLDYR